MAAGLRIALMTLLILVALVTGYTRPALAQGKPPADPVRATLLADVDQVVPGHSFRLGLLLQHLPQWHTYWRNPGDSGLPTQFNPTLPDGFSVGDIAWPRPSRFLIGPLANLGYDRDVLLVRSVQVPDQIAGRPVAIDLLAQWLVCRDVCIPGQARLSLTLPVAADGEAPVAGQHAWRFADAAREQPGQTLTVPAARVKQSVHWHLPASLADGDARMEFFPFTPGTFNHAGQQPLYRLPGSAGWRLEVPVASGQEDPAGAARAGSLAGLLVINDGRSVVVSAEPVASAAGFAGGELQSTATGHSANYVSAQQNAASALVSASRGGSSVLADRLGGNGLSSRGTTVAAPPVTGGGQSDSSALPAAATGTDRASDLSGWLVLLFALLGGLILNLMPCVFPVIGLKILGFAGSGTGNAESLTPAQRSNVRRGCLWFALGVLLSFLVLASLLLVLRQAGQAIGWGFQLQSPPFVAMMALLFVAIALNFMGMYTVGARMTQLGQLDQPTTTNAGARAAPSFLSGVLAVLVATPCTAPFMGSALGYTMSQPASVTLAVFAALGVGMALPYLLLGFLPGWLRWLPRPGRWMDTFKQLLAFPMLAAAAWLVWVLGQQAGINSVLWLLVAMIVLALSLWILGRLVQGGSKQPEVALALSVVLLGTAGVLAWPTGSEPPAQATQAVASADTWQPWSTEAVQRALDNRRPVLIDFTAAWCVTCQVNKRLVLGRDDIKAALSRRGVVLLRADWTRHDPAITAELARHGRNSIPFYLLYKPGGQAPVVLPEVLTVGSVMQAIEAL